MSSARCPPASSFAGLFGGAHRRVAHRRCRTNKTTHHRRHISPRAAYRVGAPISDCTAVVTGANRGIGLEFVTQLLEKGNRVVATCRNPDADDAGDLRALQAKSEGKLDITALDVADPASIAKWAEELSGLAGHVDVVINNAGVTGTDGYSKWDLEAGAEVQTTTPVVLLKAPAWFQQKFINLLEEGLALST